jgi:Family of unknown function (DUF5343)
MSDEVDAKGASPAARTRAKKMDRPPYTATGDIDQLFERMAGLAAPQKVDGAWATNYKLAEESIIVLKWLGVAAADGTVDGAMWAKLRVPASHQATLAELVTKSYGPILDQIDPANAGKDDIHGAFVHKYGMADTARYIRAFIKLCGLAGINLGGLDEPAAESGDKPERKPKPPAARATAAPATPARRSTKRITGESKKEIAGQVIISLNVVIPASLTGDEIRKRVAEVRRALSESEQ